MIRLLMRGIKYTLLALFCLVIVSHMQRVMAQPNSVSNITEKTQNWRAQNGIPVFFIPNDEIPMVDIAVVFDAGSARDGSKPGIANLTASLIGQNTSKLQTNAIANQWDQLGSQFSVKAQRDMTIIRLRSLSAQKVLRPSVNLLKAIISHAQFPISDFNRQQGIALQAIALSKQNPSRIAINAFFHQIYGPNPYGSPTLGTIRSVKALTNEDVQQFYQHYFVDKNALIAIVGKLNVFQAKTLANNIALAIPSGQKAKALTTKTVKSNKNITVTFPSNQTSIIMGEIGISRNSADYFPLMLGNYILGEGVTSRLFSAVREQRGLSYSINSLFVPLALRGPFLIMLQTKTAQTQQAISVTQQTVQKFIKNGPTESELQAAKDYFIGSFALSLRNNSEILSSLVNLAFYHLPLDYFYTFKGNVQKVSLAAVKRAMAEHIYPNRFITVTVGQHSHKQVGAIKS